MKKKVGCLYNLLYLFLLVKQVHILKKIKLFELKILAILYLFIFFSSVYAFKIDSTVSDTTKTHFTKDTVYIKTIDSSKIFSTNKNEENLFKDYIAPGIAILLSGAAFVFSIISLFKNLKVKRNENVKILFEMWDGTNELDINNFIQPDFTKAINAMAFTSSCWTYDIVNKEIIYSNFWEPYEYFYKFCKQNSKYQLKNLKKKTIKEYITSDIKKTFEEMSTFKKH